MSCPSSTAQSATATINPLLGGTVSVGGSSVTLPVGAVAVPTLITLTVPASQYMEVEVRANGLEHLVFQRPVRVAIDYSRCTSRRVLRKPVEAWYIDEATKALLQDMHGRDNKRTHTITFRTGHLSSYAIAQ